MGIEKTSGQTSLDDDIRYRQMTSLPLSLSSWAQTATRARTREKKNQPTPALFLPTGPIKIYNDKQAFIEI